MDAQAEVKKLTVEEVRSQLSILHEQDMLLDAKKREIKSKRFAIRNQCPHPNLKSIKEFDRCNMDYCPDCGLQQIK